MMDQNDVDTPRSSEAWQQAEKVLKILFVICFVAMIVWQFAVPGTTALGNGVICRSLVIIFWLWLFAYVQGIGGYTREEHTAMKGQVWLLGIIIACNLFPQNPLDYPLLALVTQTILYIAIIFVGTIATVYQVFCIPLGRRRVLWDKDYRPPRPPRGAWARVIGLLLIVVGALGWAFYIYAYNTLSKLSPVIQPSP